MRKEARLSVNVIGVGKAKKFKVKLKRNYLKRTKQKKNNVRNAAN